MDNAMWPFLRLMSKTSHLVGLKDMIGRLVERHEPIILSVFSSLRKSACNW